MVSLLGALLVRLTQSALVGLTVATICFAAVEAMPGDQAVRVAIARYGENGLNAATLASARSAAGLDRPVIVRYADWIGAAARLQFGRSLVTGRPVRDEVASRMRVTLLVGAFGLAVALLSAVPAGIAAGLGPGGATDRAVASGAAALASVPGFAMGSLLVAAFAVRLHWLPAAGDGTVLSLLMPAISLGLTLTPGLAHVVRHGVTAVSGAPYTVFARMRGVPRWRVAVQVAARPALVPILAYAPVLAMQVLEGFIAIELVFNLDGMGLLLLRALLARDVPVVMGAAVLVSLLLGLAVALADACLLLADPRLRAAPGLAT